MTPEEAIRCVDAICEAWPNPEPTAAWKATYASDLGDLEFADVADAIRRLRRVERDGFRPIVGKVREATAVGIGALPDDPEVIIARGWADATHGDNPSDPICRKAISAVGGAYTVRRSTTPEILRSQYVTIARKMFDTHRYAVLAADGLEALPAATPLPQLPEAGRMAVGASSGPSMDWAELDEEALGLDLRLDGDDRREDHFR